jgi:hypothetical protein
MIIFFNINEDREKVMEWIIVLNGNKTDLELLAKHFNSIDLNIVEENGQFFIRSNYLNFKKVKSFNECIKMAEKLLNIINGLSKVLLKIDNNIQSNSVNLLDKSNRLIKGYTWINCSLAIRNNNSLMTNDKNIELSTNLSKYTEKILSDDDFYRAFIFLHYDKDNWRDFYCVYEVIRDVVGNGNGNYGEKIIKSWLLDKDKSMIKVFTQTANSIKAVKEKARHGKVFDDPKIKMNLFDAKNLIYKILLIWLENYS